MHNKIIVNVNTFAITFMNVKFRSITTTLKFKKSKCLYNVCNIVNIYTNFFFDVKNAKAI